MVGANRVLRVDVNIGRHAHAHARDDGDESGRRAHEAAGYRRSSAVQVSMRNRTLVLKLSHFAARWGLDREIPSCMNEE